MGVGSLKQLQPAVFLDRDGVLNSSVYNAKSDAWESPRCIEDVSLLPGVPQALMSLSEAGFLLLLVSNQPDPAKGKASLQTIEQVHREVVRQLAVSGVVLDGAYYCHHHPQGVIAPWAGPCECRKPATGMIDQARREHRLDSSRSWMIGDRDSDVLCGQAAGLRTIQLPPVHPCPKSGNALPDFQASSLTEAAHLIMSEASKTW